VTGKDDADALTPMAGEVISYIEMCVRERASLQRGMNFRLGGHYSVLLMSRRPNAQYIDRVEDDGRVLIYEGHDSIRSGAGPDPQLTDQPLVTPAGSATQNGLFVAAAEATRDASAPAELVRVYEKLRVGVWAYTGDFDLVDAWTEERAGRRVFKFKLAISEERAPAHGTPDRTRIIPSLIKLEVWQRDAGVCVSCGRAENLHFDHIIPYSKGGSSLTAENIQLLCAEHNLRKRDRIE